MIEAEFLRFEESLVGFQISGHANSGPFGKDIVCAAVSSATMLTVNIITDYLFAPADAKDKGNKIMLVLREPGSAMCIAAKQVIKGFYDHLQILSEDYKGKIRITVRDMKGR